MHHPAHWNCASNAQHTAVCEWHPVYTYTRNGWFRVRGSFCYTKAADTRATGNSGCLVEWRVHS